MKNISIIGIRGYNVIYSGFETFIKHLVEKSDKDKFYYYLFCRKPYQKKIYFGENFSLVLVPTVTDKYLETPLYSFLSNLLSILKKIDIVLYLGLSNTPFVLLQKLLGRKVIVNTDGLDWKRKRWNTLGKTYLKICEKLTVLFANTIICDSKTVYKYFKNKYKIKNLVYIPYGAEVTIRKPGGTLKKFALTPKKYLHFVGRLTPENCVEDLILAFKEIKTDFKCVIVGDSVFEDKYKNYLLKLASDDKRIIFTGFLKGKTYEEICSNSYLYIETKSVGGTHPSLLEAMAFGNCIIAKNAQEHVETLESVGLYYEKKRGSNDLEKIIKYVLGNKKVGDLFRKLVEKRVKKYFRWEAIVKQYEEIFDV